MKTHILSLALVTLLFAACTNGIQKVESTETTPPATVSKTAPGATPAMETPSMKGLLDNYFQIKNAFTKDNAQEAAKAADVMVKTFAGFDKSTLTAEQSKIYRDIEDDAKEHAEHIAANAGKIEHQREHFEMLSKDMTDLVREFGAGQTVYLDHCPMYNKNKGANWLSETKEIANPYLGQAMPTCGTVKEELK